ncbi:MAG: hypothetical protein WBV78_13275 [Roseobacter sp.]
MTDKKNPKSVTPVVQNREDRLKDALKANLSRRKAQSRKRAEANEPKETSPGTAGQDKDA